MRTRRLVTTGLAITLSIVLLGAAGCSSKKVDLPGVDVHEFDDGGRTYVRSGTQPKGVVIWFHGLDSTGREVVESPKQPTFAAGLMARGWAIATDRAGGNAFGNPSSQSDYRALIAESTAFHKTTRVAFVAESMGAIPALLLYSQPEFRNVVGMAGVSPLMGVPEDRRTLTYIASAWSGPYPQALDPLTWSRTTLAGRNFDLYYSRADKTIPTNANAETFALRYDRVADVRVNLCTGQHVDQSCYQGQRIADWLDRLDR